MLVAHLADIHLGKQQYRLEYREFDVYNLFLEALEQCIRDHVDMILITGDLFDEPRPRVNALKTVIDGLRKVISHDIKVIITPGDHDVPKRRDRLVIDILPDIVDGVYSLGYIRGETSIVEKVFEQKKLALYAIPFIPHKNIAKKLLPKFLEDSRRFFSTHKEYRKILLAHYSLKELLPYDAMFSITQIPSVDYAAFGHIHDRIKQYIPSGGVLAYPGSIDIFSINEAISWKDKGKGFNIIDLSKKDITIESIHWVNLDIRPQYVIDIDKHNIEKLHDMLTELVNTSTIKPIIVHVKARIPEHAVTTLRAHTNRAMITHGDALFIRLYVETIEENNTIKEGERLKEELDEASIIASLIKSTKEVAEHIVELAEKLASGEYTREDIEKILKELYSEWFKHIDVKTYNTLAKTTLEKKQPKTDTKKPRNILDFLQH
ncbi:DNA repair exonuclease [Desulfurococcaceae archaeon MEX13E-LK6-19]|nr:DNA repair exonuclease [Desulfurococcaceae archaeon MEX13E-LK6-19]